MKLICKRNIENDFGVMLFTKGKEYQVEIATGGVIILAWHPPIGDLSCNTVFNVVNNYTNGFMNLQYFFKISPALLKFLKSNVVPSRISAIERFDL